MTESVTDQEDEREPSSIAILDSSSVSNDTISDKVKQADKQATAQGYILWVSRSMNEDFHQNEQTVLLQKIRLINRYRSELLNFDYEQNKRKHLLSPGTVLFGEQGSFRCTVEKKRRTAVMVRF